MSSWRAASGLCGAGLVVALFVLFVVPAVSGFGVSLAVDQQLHGTVLMLDDSTPVNGSKMWGVEAVNRGSTAFTGWLRFDVRDEEDAVVFRTWSDVMQLEPGASRPQVFGFHDPNVSGVYTADVVLHYGVNRAVRSTTFEVEPVEAVEGFRLVRSRLRGDVVDMDVRVPSGVDDLFVTVGDRTTRRFAQVHVVGPERYESVAVPYHPVIEDGEVLEVQVFSGDGSYHVVETVRVEQEASVLAGLRWRLAGVFHRVSTG